VRLVENTFWQLLDQGVGRGLLFVFYLCIPLALGIEEYGRFAFLHGVIGLAVQPAILLGLDLIVVKKAARGDSSAFGNALRARTFLVALTGLAVTLAGAVIAPDNLPLLWLLWLYYGLLGFAGLVFAHFRALERMRMEGVIGALQKALALPALGLLVLAGVRTATAPAMALALTAAAGLLLLPALYGADIAALVRATRQAAPNMSGTLAIAGEGITAGLAVFAGLAYFRIDSVLLGLLRGNEDVGVYNVAHRIMEGTLIVPAIVATVVYPRIARSAGDSPALRWTTLALGTLGIAVSVVFVFGGERLVAAIYGAEHEASGAALSVLALAIAPAYAGAVLTQALIATDRQGSYLRLALLALVLNVALNLALIPGFGTMGAAAAAVATELAVAAMAVAALR
jgi:O-antigen/teichoic acid export membrane protein